MESVTTIDDECSQVGWRLMPFEAHNYYIFKSNRRDSLIINC